MPLVGVSSVNVFHTPKAPSFHCHHPGAFCFLYTVVSSTKIKRKPMNSVINFACTECTLVKIILNRIIEYTCRCNGCQ